MSDLRIFGQRKPISDVKTPKTSTSASAVHARGAEFFLLNRFNTAHSECSQIRYYQPKNQQF